MINISLEPTGFCNAKCYYCINGQERVPYFKHGDFLSLDIHRKLFQDLDSFMDDFACSPTLDKNIYLRYCGVGEPTLHPDFIAMFEQGLNFPAVRQIAILSNGAKWDKDLVDRFIKASSLQPHKPLELIFSLDTLNLHTQFKIKKLSNIEKIIEQLIYLIDQKVNNQLNNIYIILQMIILNENILEVNEFCDFWSEILTRRGFSPRVVYLPDYPKYFSENQCFIWLKRCDGDRFTQHEYNDLHTEALRQMGIYTLDAENHVVSDKTEYCISRVNSNRKYPHICSLLWYGVNVSTNADVSPCCSDVNFELKIGSLKENSLIEIYRSDAMRRLRYAHIHRNLQDYPICMNCSILYRGPLVSDDDVVEYLNIAEATK